MQVVIRKSTWSSGLRCLPSIFTFVVAMGACSFATADDDCDDNNCADNGNYRVKIKRLPDIELSDWGGESNLSGDTLIGSGKQFCTIAYREGSPRKMFDVITSIDGSASIPVTFTIKSVDSKAPQPEQTYGTGRTVTLNGNDSYDQSKDNELILSAKVSSEDILKNSMTGTYSGSFRFYSGSDTDGTSLGKAFMKFDVTLEVLPVMQISGLKDIALTPQGNIAKGSHQFCVFAMRKNRFKLRVTSQMAEEVQYTKRYGLKNGDSNYILYYLSIADSKGMKKDFNSNYDHTGWGYTHSQSYQCQSHTSPNMTRTIRTESIDGATGTYSDTLTFTVSPHY